MPDRCGSKLSGNDWKSKNEKKSCWSRPENRKKNNVFENRKRKNVFEGKKKGS